MRDSFLVGMSMCDQKVSPQEVIAFRKRFGIAADGTLLRAQKQKIGTSKICDP